MKDMSDGADHVNYTEFLAATLSKSGAGKLQSTQAGMPRVAYPTAKRFCSLVVGHCRTLVGASRCRRTSAGARSASSI